METRNLLVFLHGIMLDEHPPLGRAQYRHLWEAVRAAHPALEERFFDADVVEVEWGKFIRDTIEPDQWINLAQEQLARQVDPLEVRKNPGPLNLVLPSRPASLPSLAWECLVGPLRQVLLLRGMGDMFYYCGEDGQIAVQSSVFQQIFDAMEPYREREVRLRIHVVAHSLGVSIAYDFLQSLFCEREPVFCSSGLLPRKRELTTQRLKAWRGMPERLELGSLATLGSPLPLLLLRNQRVVDSLATGNVLDPREIGLVEGTDIVWKNFYDDADMLALPIRPVFGSPAAIQDIQVRSGDDPWALHAYWGSRDVHEHVAELLGRRSAVPAPVTLA